LPTKVREALTRHSVDPIHLELEATESVMVGDVLSAAKLLSDLKATGVSIAMDDFGTGYSSMALLRKLPIDVLKIDRSFVADLIVDPGAAAIATAIVSLAKTLSLRIAEGIENSAQADLLRRLGCDELQGFLYGKPMPAQQFEVLSSIVRTLRS
jgi:diguanylate cyclase